MPQLSEGGETCGLGLKVSVVQNEFHVRLRAIRCVEQAKKSDCHLAWVTGALPLCDPEDPEVCEANRRVTAWLRECRRRTVRDTLCDPLPIPSAQVDPV